MNILVPISLGELIDKITILKIKIKEINDITKIDNIQKELSLLETILDQTELKKELETQFEELYNVNYELWKLEDTIRSCERESNFELKFVNTARLIYKTNDQRSVIKKQINLKYNSNIIEEKSYQDWR